MLIWVMDSWLDLSGADCPAWVHVGFVFFTKFCLQWLAKWQPAVIPSLAFKMSLCYVLMSPVWLNVFFLQLCYWVSNSKLIFTATGVKYKQGLYYSFSVIIAQKQSAFLRLTIKWQINQMHNAAFSTCGSYIHGMSILLFPSDFLKMKAE